jgi:hypothetical protein
MAAVGGGLARTVSSAAPQRRLLVTVLECRALKKMDGRFGNNDVFVTVDVDGQELSSSTVHDGGTAPRWGGGAGELLTFALTREPEMLLVSAFDEDTGLVDKVRDGETEGKSSELIGAERVALKYAAAATNIGEDWSSCEWYTLTDDRDNKTGEVRLFLRWAVPLPTNAPMEWQLHASILECRKLKKMDVLGKNDVYVRVHAQGARMSERTTTIEEGGTAPKWGTETTPGEALDLQLSEAPPALGIEVWEEDKLKSDLIGCNVLEIGTQVKKDGWNWTGWSPITDYKEGKVTGEVRVRLVWRYVPVEHDPDADVRHFHVNVLECRGLKNVDGFRGLNDVYVIADVDGDALTSSVVDDGGAAPRWNGGAGEDLEFTPKKPPQSLRVGVLDKNKGADKDIGTCGIRLDHKPADEDWKSCEWYSLKDDKGAAAGEVRLFLRWAMPEPWVVEGLNAAPSRDWLIQVTVIECSGLKKMDALGKNDVYVCANALGDPDGGQRTSTVDEGGEAPVWANGAGEVLNMWLSEPPPAVGIEVYEEDTLTSDLIGCNVIEVGTRIGDSEWGTESWYDLTDQAKGAKTGRVRVQLRWRPAPKLDPYGRRLRVTVLECRGLKKMDLVGENDVFVAVHIDGEVLKTSVVDGGGAAPRWNRGSGQELLFTPNVGDPQTMLVRAFDQDKGKDELIGTLASTLGEHSYDEDWSFCDWYGLHDAEGSQTGEIRLFLRWAVPPSPREGMVVAGRGEWHLQTTVIECRELKKMDLRGENDVFVRVHAHGAKKPLQTSTVDEGGEAPMWAGGGEALNMYMDEAPPSVAIEVFEEDKLKSDLIGCHILEVGTQIGKGQWSTEGWFTLSDYKSGKATGQVRVQLTWKLAPTVDPFSRRLLVSVLECRSLKKMDKLGHNDVFVTIDVDDEEMSSSVVDDGGAAPKWNGGAGEAMVFTPPFDPESLRVQIFDKDQTSDELIGTHVESLRREQALDATGADRRTNTQKLVDAYEDQAAGQGADSSLVDDAIAEVIDDMCQAVEEVTEAQIAEIKNGNDWTSCEWYEIVDDSGRITGEVRLFLRWAVPLPPTSPREWQLLATVFECSGLKSMETLGKNDVFVKMHARGTEHTKAKPDGSERTITIKDGGAAPHWGENGSGQDLDLRLYEVPPSIGVEVYEEDLVKADLIGCYVLDVGTQIGEGEWETEGWYDLTDRTGTVTGRIRFKASWLIAPAEDISYAASKISGDWRMQHLVDENRRRAIELDKRRRDVKKMKLSLEFQSNKKTSLKVRQTKKLAKCLQVVVLECRGLKKMGRGLNNPYLTLDVDGQTLKSTTVEHGGAAPRWGDAAGELLVFTPHVEPAKMFIRVFDETAVGDDDLIGTHNVVLTALAAASRGNAADHGPGITFRKSHLSGEHLHLLRENHAKHAYRTASGLGNDPDCPVEELIERVLQDVCKAVSDADAAAQAAVTAGRDWSNCEWLSLTNEQGKITGEVRLFLRWSVPPPAPDSVPCDWQLLATVVECTKLKSVSKLGKNDVFVQMHALGADSCARTSTIQDGGDTPVWRYGDGENLELRLRQAPPAVGIQVFDEGALSNTLIGSRVLEVASQIGENGAWSTEDWFDVTDWKAGKTTGQVHVRLEWELVPVNLGVTRRLTYSGTLDAEEAAEEAAAELVEHLIASVFDEMFAETAQPDVKKTDADDLPSYACLEACLLECRSLKQMDLFESNNVFVTLTLDGDTQRSATIQSGAAAPAWDGGAGQRMIFRSRKLPSTLRIRSFNEDMDDFDVIGSHELSLEPRWKMNPDAGKDWNNCEWYPLIDGQGESAGEARIFLRWGIPRPMWAAREWQLRVAVLECSGLKKMGTLGKNDVFVQVNAMGAETAQRTSTIEAGGGAPVWSDGDEEPMLFKLSDAPPSVGIEVFDEDHVVAYAAQATQQEHRGRDDQLIGFHVFELKSKLDRRADPLEGEWSSQTWLELSDRNGQTAGRVHVRFEWLRDSLLPPPPAPLPKQEREVCFLLDEHAHVGGTLNRTVTFLRDSVDSLQQEASMRFNRGLSPTRFQRSSQVFRDEYLPPLTYKRGFRDAFVDCDVQLVYRVEDDLEGVCAQPVDDPVLIARVRHELEKRWVYVDHKAERKAAQAAGIFEDEDGKDDDSPPFWQLWVGAKETPEIVFEEPPPLPPQPPIRLASVTTDAELAALGNDRRLYASQVRTSHRTLPTEAERDAAAIVIQARVRGILDRVETSAHLEAVLLVQRCCHRYVARQVTGRLRAEYLRKKAEAEAAAALRARYDALVNKGNTMATSMDNLLVDMHEIIGVNETELKGTDGWTVYEKSRKKEADAALAALNGSINDRSSAAELQHALDLYMSCSVSDPLIEEQMRKRIAARELAEKEATTKLRASTTQCEGQAAALVAQFQEKVDDPNFASSPRKSRRVDRVLKAGDTRRWAMLGMLTQYKQALDTMEGEAVVSLTEIAGAREVHAKLLAEEEARIAEEDAIRLAKEQSLVQAFDATVLHYFSPDKSDGKTAYERTLAAAAASKKRAEWATFEQKFNSDGEEIVPPPNDGRALGVFRELPGEANKKAMVIPPSNELITPAYAAMIASRHPEEKRRRRRPEAEVAKKYTYSAESDPFELLRIPDAKKRRPKADTQERQLATLHPLLDDGYQSTLYLLADAPNSTETTQVLQLEGGEGSEMDDGGSSFANPPWDPDPAPPSPARRSLNSTLNSTLNSSGAFAAAAAQDEAPPTPVTDWQLAMAHPKTPPRDPFGLPPVTPPGQHSALRRRVSGRRSGQGLTSGSPGDFASGKESFLEGWTQYAAVQLDRGGGIPALGGVNPVRALASVSRAGRRRGVQ